uniref:Methyltransferase domain-containing protein n=1 Tax=Guillardia theta TaxID=55529 RepID=A0A7S4L2L4_GUITH|mmetsp:Transcript_36207/g.113048  ORF Transcript_36207/g.113048 Transcript_36207/m.113048 type:complete len:500 (+) Transcript_36207:110-1609(+)
MHNKLLVVFLCSGLELAHGFSLTSGTVFQRRGGLQLSKSSSCQQRSSIPSLAMSIREGKIEVGVSDEVQNVGRGRLLAKDDAIKEVSGKVQGLYDAYPYPPEAVFDGVTCGYNHRWSYTHAYNFVHGHAPVSNEIEILDAGCGTGVTAQYLSHLNPRAKHFDALDLSAEALKVAKERAERAFLVGNPNNAQFHHMSLYDVAKLDRTYDFINCVGVLHHLPDPVKGLRALCERLKPGGIMHIFVYSALGRREIMLMQEALALLQGGECNFKEGVALGREVFKALPDSSRIKTREKERWAMENERDSTFADMYLHPQEVDYTVPSLMQWIDTVSDLDIKFAGFSNPKLWKLDRLLGGAPDALARAKKLSQEQQYRLVELLDPDTFTHYEFFLVKGDVKRKDWREVSDEEFYSAKAIRQAGIQPWPADRVFDQDYNLVQFTDAEYAFLQLCAQDPTVETFEYEEVEEPQAVKDIVAKMDSPITKEEILRLLDLEFLFLQPSK